MADPQMIQALLAGRSVATTGVTPGANDQTKLRELATQFESMLLSQMLKDLQTSMADDEDGSAGFKSGPLGDVMTSEVGLALSRAGGFGLGDMLAAAMSRQSGPSISSPASPAQEPADYPVPVATAVQAYAVPAPRISSGFGWREDPIDGGARFHKGMDVPMSVGSDVRVPADGQVVSVGEQPGYGLTVVVAHGNGLETRYGHLSAADVRPGDPVRAGDLIARSGNSGRSTGPHLHFEVVENGQAINPEGWLGAVVARPAPAGQ